MFSIKTKLKLTLKVTLVFLLALLTACNKEKTNEYIELNDCRYVISLSKALDYNARLLFIDTNGSLLGTYDYDGYSINSINQRDGNFYMHSSRLNKHYILNNEQKISSYTLFEDEYTDSIQMASWFAVNGKSSLIETMNIGGSESGDYLSSIIYGDQDSKTEVVLKNQLLNNAIELNGKIYVETFSETDEKNGISIIEMSEQREIKYITFPEPYTSNSAELILLEDKIITYGHSEIEKFEGNLKSSIGSLDTNTYETNNYVLDNELVITMYTYNNNIYVITDNNKLMIFDKNLNILSSAIIGNDSFINNAINDNYRILKMIQSQNHIHVFYLSRDFDKPDHIGYIQVYEKETLKPLERFEINNPDATEWLGESVDFILKQGY